MPELQNWFLWQLPINKSIFLSAAALLVIGFILFSTSSAQAHGAVPVGESQNLITYSWLHEPPIAGQPNGVLITVVILDPRTLNAPTTANPAQPITLTLLSPQNGAVIEGNRVDVKVAIEGLEQPGAHWHIYLDGQLLSMLGVQQPSFPLTGLADGKHSLVVSLSDVNHIDMGTPVRAEFQVGNSTVDNRSPVSPLATPGASTAISTPASAVGRLDAATFFRDLTAQIEHNGLAQPLNFQPVITSTVAEFVAPLTPSEGGIYTLRFAGMAFGSPVDASAALVEVEKPDLVTYLQTLMAAPTLTTFDLTSWLVIAVLGVGLFSLLLGVVVLITS